MRECANNLMGKGSLPKPGRQKWPAPTPALRLAAPDGTELHPLWAHTLPSPIVSLSTPRAGAVAPRQSSLDAQASDGSTVIVSFHQDHDTQSGPHH